jgi:hypothetical protein
MKTYKVYAEYVCYLEHIVLAESEDEAWKIVNDMDGGSFKQVATDDWSITDVEEIKQ